MDLFTGWRRGAVLSGGLALTLGLTLTTPALAWDDAGKDSPEVLAEGLLAPALGLAVGPRGDVYASQLFSGTLTKIPRKGTPTDVVPGEAEGMSGVVVGPWNGVTYLTGGWVKRLRYNGETRVLNKVSLADYESTENPDQVKTYGFQGLTEKCAAQVPAEIGGDPYPGIVDSNPYAVAYLPNRGVVVADAAGNTLIRVTRSGKLRTLAVLPPRPIKITADIQAGVGLPKCTKGATYNFEFVPTDVEVGPDGMLYVTSLPGGPEDASLGARGAVFKVNPWNGKATEVATGFLGAVDLALDKRGRIYVAELFGNAITKIGRNGNTKVAEVEGPGALEYANGKLYATVGNGFDAFGQPVASVVSLKP